MSTRLACSGSRSLPGSCERAPSPRGSAVLSLSASGRTGFVIAPPNRSNRRGGRTLPGGMRIVPLRYGNLLHERDEPIRSNGLFHGVMRPEMFGRRKKIEGTAAHGYDGDFG